MLSYKASLNKFNRIKIISSVFSDHSGTKVEINYMEKTGNFTNMWKMHNMHEQLKGQTKNKRGGILKEMKMEITYLTQQKQF